VLGIFLPGADDAGAWVAGKAATDDGLLTFLSRARGWAAGSGGVYYPLRRRDLDSFLDYDDAVRRVRAIAANAEADAADRQLAQELLVAIEQGEESP